MFISHVKTSCTILVPERSRPRRGRHRGRNLRNESNEKFWPIQKGKIVAKVLADSIGLAMTSATSKKLPNVYKSCPKMILLEKLKILTPLQKLPKMWAIWVK